MNKKEYVIHQKPIPYMLVKNYFSEDDIEHMFRELKFLTPKMEFQDGTNLPTKDHKKNVQINLDKLYENRDTSNILNVMNKIYNDGELISNLEIASWFYEVWGYTNNDNTFVAYYENTDYYKAHWDSSITTILRWFYREPKKYTGGDLTFTESGEKIKCKHNRMIMFPGYYLHEVDPIKMEEEHKNKNLGRYTLTTFYYYSS